MSSDNLSVTFTTQAPPAGACDGVTNSSSAPEGTPDPYALNGNTYVVSWDFTNDNHDLGGKQTLTNKADITIADVELTQVNKSQEVQIAGGSAGGDASNAIPGTPTVNPAECGVNDTGTVWETVTLPTGGFFTYTQDTDADHKVTVTATVKPGAVLTDDLPDGWTANADRSAATWTYQLKSEECSTPEVSVVPVAPVVNPAECTVDTQGTTVWETVTQPANTDGITYSDVVVSDDHVATITATAAEGFVLDAEALGDGWVMNEDGTATWTYQLKSKTCAAAPIVKPTTPGLATTGGTLPLGLAGGAVVLLLAGLVTVAAAKRQRANQQ